MAKTNKIVISGYYGFDNIGDEAVLYTIITTLKKEIPSAKIMVLSNNPEKTAQSYGVQSINRWDFKNIIRVIKNSDLLISGGGSLLQDVTSSKTIPYYLAIVKLAQLYKKKVVFYSQGIGPVNKKFGRWLIKRVANKVDAIFVRDEASKQLLQEIGVKKDVGVAIDPVLGIATSKSKEKLGKTVGIYIRPWENEEQNQKMIIAMKEGLIELLQKGYKLYMVPMHYEQDLEISRALKAALEIELKDRELNLENQITVLDKKLSIKEVLRYTAEFDFVIGMRLHSLIMAAANCVPMIGLSYDPKVTSFIGQIGVPYCIDVKEIDSNNFKQNLEDLEKDLNSQQELLKQSYERNKDKLKLPIDSIKELLK